MDRKDLDRPEYGSYEDVHEQLVQAMQEACMNDTSREYKTPDIDMSFLYDDTVPEVKTKHRFTRFNKVAAIVIATLLGLNAVLLISDSNEVYSEKGLLHRICEGARGIFTDEDLSQFVEMDETWESCVIESLNNLHIAKGFCENLYVPKNIPETFKFSELYVKNNMEGDYIAEYEYSLNDMVIHINVKPIQEEKCMYNGKNNTIYLDDRVICIYWDDLYNAYVADIYTEENYICIYGLQNYELIMEISMKI